MGDISIDDAVKNFKLIDDEREIHIKHELNIDKIKDIDDCKKILKFLCNLSIKPLPNGIEYCGFSEVEQYFD